MDILISTHTDYCYTDFKVGFNIKSFIQPHSVQQIKNKQTGE